jgi:hypothetical protein
MVKKSVLLILALLLMFSITVPAYADDGDEDKDSGKQTSAYCLAGAQTQHPVAKRIAERYDTPYETVMQWFCQGGYGFGQIMLALQTASSPNVSLSADQLLAEKQELGGWGQVWKKYGLKGKSGKAGKPDKPGKEKNKDKEKDKDGDDTDTDTEEEREGKGPPPWANNKKDD